jgi:uncharacterized membrane protein YgdD (TMEM256/DUF423 family)
MHKKMISLGALLCAVAVIAGAFGAHFLKTKLTPEALQTFETAVRYQFYHAFALLAAGILYKDYPTKLVQRAGTFFTIGIILFSGSLYILCAVPTVKWIGAITPFGGLCFIAGWLAIAFAVTKKAKNLQ